MSMHKKPLSQIEESGLRAHGLDIGTPSQLSDVFRQGVAWGLLSQTERIATLEQQNAELVAALECAEFLFDRKWNSVVGSGCEFNWQPVGNWRHYTCKMTGETFLEAIAKVKQP